MRTMPGVVPRSLKKVLSSRVELRLVAILLSLAALAALGFGAFMKDGAERSTPRGGALGRVAFRIGSTPQNLYRRFFRDPEPPQVWGVVSEQRFHGRDGLTFAPPPVTRQDGEAGYLIVARHVPFPEKNGAEPAPEPPPLGVLPIVIDIIDLHRRKTVHSWKQSLDYRQRHFFYILSDGSLLTGRHMGRVTFRMDACSNVVWEQRMHAHHSFERDADGNFWSPRRVVPSMIPHTNPGFAEDGLVRFSPDGEVLSRITLSGALIRADHRHLLYGTERVQGIPIHMNDVEPVLQDGPFWRRGDLFVSLRNRSVVLLYRPATDEVLWLQAGPWLHQHDVDVVSDSEISVYSNNSLLAEDPPRVLGANEVYVHDFATGETRSPWREAMRRHDVRTANRGGATVFADGSVMLEEADYGRILKLSPDGERVWSYVNRASDGMIYKIATSRWLDAEYGAGVVRSIASRDC